MNIMYTASIHLILVNSALAFSVFSVSVTEYDTTTEYQTTFVEDTNTTEVATTTQEGFYQEPDNEYSPFQVSLHYSYNDDFICGGSIVSPKIVLTAAHCMFYRWGGLMPPIIVTVAAGRKRLNDTAWRIFDVANITLHPLYNQSSMDHDLALIEVEGSFESDGLVSQIDMEKHVTSLGYNNCIVTGWNQDSYEFQVMSVVLIDCGNYPKHICTNKKYPSSTQCINNAGNPLVCDDKLIGVLSVESECEDPNQLFIFENIRYSMSWLNESIGSGCKSVKNNYRNLFLTYLLFMSFFSIG